MYADGRGVQIDDAEAVRWYKKAAERGNAAAQYHLGARYTLGRGVQKDEVEADRWIRRAAEQGNVDAIRFLMLSQ
jgi:TPR repeat protein